jgi:hypothetical protein
VGNDQDKNLSNRAQRDAAVRLAREKVLQSFKSAPHNYTDTDTPEIKKEQKADESTANSYDKTMASSTSAPTISAKEWKKYHSAWQDYYQKYL